MNQCSDKKCMLDFDAALNISDLARQWENIRNAKEEVVVELRYCGHAIQLLCNKEEGVRGIYYQESNRKNYISNDSENRTEFYLAGNVLSKFMDAVEKHGEKMKTENVFKHYKLFLDFIVLYPQYFEYFQLCVMQALYGERCRYMDNRGCQFENEHYSVVCQYAQDIRRIEEILEYHFECEDAFVHMDKMKYNLQSRLRGIKDYERILNLELIGLLPDGFNGIMIPKEADVVKNIKEVMVYE
ncbi:MAG: hypothetical protein IJA54_09725 [Tyzzerella sp.]|nr:hypothetical protein [Tyzzerella sp.]